MTRIDTLCGAHARPKITSCEVVRGYTDNDSEKIINKYINIVFTLYVHYVCITACSMHMVEYLSMF